MPKFKLWMQRTRRITESCTFEVEADNLEAAIERQWESDDPEGPWVERETDISVDAIEEA